MSRWEERIKSVPWPILVFDCLLACLFVPGFFADVGAVRAPDAEATPADLVMSHVVCCLDGALAVSQVGAIFLLVCGDQAARVWQRVVFWSLLLRTVFIVMVLMLPSEGGVGGFLEILATPFFVILTVLGLWAAVWLNKD